MSSNNTEMVVNTRANQTSTSPTVESLNESVTSFTSVLDEISQRLADMQVQQNLFQQELARLRSGEGTSNGFGFSNGVGRTSTQSMMQYGRMSKIDFPKFNGEDVKGWVFRCRQFFRIDNVPEEMKIQMAAMHVYDRALTWHEQFIKRYGEESSWELYEEEVLKRFGMAFDDPLVELKNLKQTGSVQSYQDLFEGLLNKVELTEKQAISMFLGGLKDEVFMPIRMFSLTSLADVFSMARLQESTNVVMKSRYAPSTSYSRPTSFGNGNRGNGLLLRPNNQLALPAPVPQVNNGQRSNK